MKRFPPPHPLSCVSFATPPLTCTTAHVLPPHACRFGLVTASARRRSSTWTRRSPLSIACYSRLVVGEMLPDLETAPAPSAAATQESPASEQQLVERASSEPSGAKGGASPAGGDSANIMRAVCVVGQSAGSAPGTGAIAPSGQSAAISAAAGRASSKQLPAERVSPNARGACTGHMGGYSGRGGTHSTVTNPSMLLEARGGGNARRFGNCAGPERCRNAGVTGLGAAASRARLQRAVRRERGCLAGRGRFS